MNNQEAIEFLEQHQPMPSDELLDTATIARFDEVRKYFFDNPNDQVVRLLLNSFGDCNGFGVYQLVENTILRHSPDVVICELAKSLGSENRWVKYWSTEIACHYSDPSLEGPLINILLDENSDFDVKYSVLVALEQFERIGKLEVVQSWIDKEVDQELIDFGNEIIRKGRSSR